MAVQSHHAEPGNRFWDGPPEEAERPVREPRFEEAARIAQAAELREAPREHQEEVRELVRPFAFHACPTVAAREVVVRLAAGLLEAKAAELLLRPLAAGAEHLGGLPYKPQAAPRQEEAACWPAELAEQAELSRQLPQERQPSSKTARRQP